MSNDNSGARRTFDRRTLLKSSLTGAIGVGLAASHSTKADSMAESPDADVIVVGGGFAGVTAARELSHRGFNTVLLEARNRLGGRTLTAPFGGHDVDMGGTWFGPGQPHIWSEVTRYGLELEESAAAQAEQAVWWDSGQRVVGTMSQWAQIHETGAEKFYAPARDAYPRPFKPLLQPDTGGFDRMSAQEVIDTLSLGDAERNLLESFTAINGHSPPSKSSYLDQLHWFALGGFSLWNLWDNLSRYRAAGGTRVLLERMQADSRANVKLGAVVKRIVQTSNGVAVELRSGELLRARQAIVAVPMNCLNDIQFEPGLSGTKRAASKQRHTGSGTKVYARIDGPRPRFLGTGKQDFPLCFAWTEYDDAQAQLLCGFGASPDYLDINDDEAVAAAFRRYAPDINVTEVYGYDWNLDPYAKGTWCMYPPGMLTESLSELQRPEGAIHFAGGDIADGWRGFIDGAIETGLSAARAVANAIETSA